MRLAPCTAAATSPQHSLTRWTVASLAKFRSASTDSHSDQPGELIRARGGMCISTNYTLAQRNEVYSGELSGARFVLAMLNRTPLPRVMYVDLKRLGVYIPGATRSLYNVWTKNSSAVGSGETLRVVVPPHDTSLYIVGRSSRHLKSDDLDGLSLVSLGGSQGTLRCEDIGKRSRQCISIPFAAAPLGKLRFAPPQAPAAWSGVRDATVAAAKPICLQGNKPPIAGSTSEDCLYLNVQAPRAPNSSKPYPVVVWIHGGGYETGSAQNFSGLVELAGDVIVVGVAYRMGWAGFLGSKQLASSGLDVSMSTGNVGIQDQRAAMRWARENIAQFGGDPKKITIDGCSAGAGSVAVHMVSKRSWSYFDRAAGQSGVTAAWNSLPLANAQTFFDIFAKASNCAAGASQVACLQNVSAADTAKHATAAWAQLMKQPDFEGNNNYSPTVDGVELLDTPRKLVMKGDTFDGPVLLGTAADEVCSLEGKDYSFKLSEAAFKADVLSEYKQFNISLPKMMELYGSVGHGQPNVSCGCGSPQFLPNVCKPCKYPGRYSPWWWSVIERGSDFGFHCTTRQFSANFGSKHSVYTYTYKVLKQQFNGLYCCPHCSELGNFLFQTPPDVTTAQGKLQFDFASYIISFYRSGDPNQDTAPDAVTWPTYKGARSSMSFALPDNGGVKVEANYRGSQCEYWETLPGGPD